MSGLVGAGNAAIEAGAKGKIGSAIKSFFGGEGMQTALGYGKGLMTHEGVGKVAANAAFMGSVGAVGNTAYQAGVNQDYNVLGNGIQGFMGGAVVGAGVAGIGLARKSLLSNAGKGAEAVVGAAKPLGKLRGVQGGPGEISDARYMASLADMEKQGARRAAERTAAMRQSVIDPASHELGSVGSMWNKPISANRNAGLPTMPSTAHSRSVAARGSSFDAIVDRVRYDEHLGQTSRSNGALDASRLGGVLDAEIDSNKLIRPSEVTRRAPRVVSNKPKTVFYAGAGGVSTNLQEARFAAARARKAIDPTSGPTIYASTPKNASSQVLYSGAGGTSPNKKDAVWAAKLAKKTADPKAGPTIIVNDSGNSMIQTTAGSAWQKMQVRKRSK